MHQTNLTYSVTTSTLPWWCWTIHCRR